MITLCTVLLEELRPFMELMINSLLHKHSGLVTNILIADIDAADKYTTTSTVKNVQVETFGCPLPIHVTSSMFGHALGLHGCIDRATTPYLMFCDPDVIFISDTPTLYFNLMKKFTLNYVGCSHEFAVGHAETYFPYVVNSLVKKEDLPDENFLKDLLYYRGLLTVPPFDHISDLKQYPPAEGKYLLRGTIPGLVDEFPNQQLKSAKKSNIDFDTGCNLHLWAKQKDWRWLSFLTPDVHIYSTGYYRSNCNVKLSTKQPLIYHQVGRYRKRNEFGKLTPEAIEDFTLQYQKYTKEENE